MSDLIHIGVGSKPAGCESCAYSKIGKGFCPDYSPLEPKIAILDEGPSTDEIFNNEPWTGAAGWKIFYDLIKPLGYRKEDLLIAKTIRCNPPGYPWKKTYPTGIMRGTCETQCRQYDDLGGIGRDKSSLKSFDPDMFICTIHPQVLMQSTASLFLIREHFAKAFRFAEAGRRPLLVLGDKALGIVAPHLTGIKRFAGHWENWKYADMATVE